MSEVGDNLVLSFEVISKYGKELNALIQTLEELAVKTISEADLPCKLAGNVAHGQRYDDSGWICTDTSVTIPLMSKNKRLQRPEMYLGFQLSLMGSGIAFDGNHQPLIHTCLWQDKLGLTEEDYSMDYPLVTPARSDFNRLLVWDQDRGGWQRNDWTFTLQLLTLHSSDALVERLIKPAMALIKEEGVESALPSDLPGLVIYRDDSAFNGTGDVHLA